MNRFSLYLLHLSFILVGVSGIGYALTRYILPSPDPFRSVHPLDPLVQRLHVLFSPLLVFAVGNIFYLHALNKLGEKRKKFSGILLLLSFFPMVVSGSWIQIATKELERKLAVAVHLATALLWLLSYGFHALFLINKNKK